MHITAKTPNITQYRIQMESGDPFYHRCMWANINLDNDTFTMTATSDSGDYSYRWAVEKNGTFKRLMAQVDKQYLLGKISDRSYFDYDASMARLLEDAKHWDLSPGQYADLKDIEYGSAESYFRQVTDIVTDIDYDSIPVEMEYPAEAVTFADLFVEVLQLVIKKELEGRA